MLDHRDLEVIARRLEELTTRKIDEKFSERLESEIRNAVRVELDKMLIKMRDLIK
jgi:hypothetical protein